MDALFSGFLQFLHIYTYLIVGFFLAINSAYLILIGFSFFHIRRQVREKDVFGMQGLFASNLYYPISILAPAFNEEATVVASVKSLLQLRFPNFEVIVINDGSKDRTLDVLIEEFKLIRVKRYVPLILDHKPIRGIYKSKLYPELIVVDKVNGRKADALNAGINVCRNDLFCAIDADCVLEPNVLQNMLRCFVEEEHTIAVGGIVRVANDCEIQGNEIKEVRLPKSFLARIQVVEYLRAFLFGRVGWDYLDSLLIISGAFGIFDRKAVLNVGGYLHDTVGEDMELVVRMHRYHRENKIPYRVRFLPEPVCWTEVPEDWKVLSRQRNRWQRGLADTLWRHRKMLFNPKYGRLGMIAMPFFFLFELLAPVIELLGYLILIISILLIGINFEFAGLFLAAAIMLGMILSVASVLCEEFTFRRYPRLKDIITLTIYAFLENLGFRQLQAWWRLTGIIDFIKGYKEWGAKTRKGFNSAAKTTPSLVATPAPTESGNTDTSAQLSQSVPAHDPEMPSSELPAETPADEFVGDKTSDFGAGRSYISYSTERQPDEPADENSAVKDRKAPLPLWAKLAAAALVLAILSVSIWPKIRWSLDQFRISPEIATLLPNDGLPGSDIDSDESDTAEPGELAIVTPERSETIDDGYGTETPGSEGRAGTYIPPPAEAPVDPMPGFRWDPTHYYFYVWHTFSSPERAELAIRTRDRMAREFDDVTMYPRIGNSGIILWMVGTGRAPHFWVAANQAGQQPRLPANYFIMKAGPPEMEMFGPIIDLDRTQPVYTIRLGTYSSREQQELAAAKWRSAGFNNLRMGQAPAFGIYTGLYNSPNEARLLAELIYRRSGVRAEAVPGE